MIVEGYAAHGVGMTTEHMHTFACAHVPHTNGGIFAAGNQPAYVLAVQIYINLHETVYGRAAHFICVAEQYSHAYAMIAKEYALALRLTSCWEAG
jgi:hypothetical protein